MPRPTAAAFPLPLNAPHGGMSIRTYIATAALQGLLAADNNTRSIAVEAELAVQAADALIARLNR